MSRGGIDPAKVLSSLARAVASARSSDPLSLRMCQASVDLLRADGGSLNLAFAEPRRTTLCATGGDARSLEDLQEVIGEGPGVAAFREERLIRTSLDDAADARWPLFTEAARTALGGPAVILAVPIRPRYTVLGVATFFGRSSSWGPDLTLETIRLLVNAVGVALVDDDNAESAAELTPHRLWTQDARVHQAVGMVIAQLGVSAEDALALLKAHAYAHSVSLSEISSDVTARRLDFHEDDPDPDPAGPTSRSSST